MNRTNNTQSGHKQNKRERVCDNCGTSVDVRGYHKHEGSYKCDYLADQRQIEEENLVKLDWASPKIKEWLSQNTEFGVIELRSNYEEGGPTWKPKTHYASYTTEEALRQHRNQYRIVNPRDSAARSVDFDNGSVIPWPVGFYGKITIDYDDDVDVDVIKRKRKGWLSRNIVYDRSGYRIGTINRNLVSFLNTQTV